MKSKPLTRRSFLGTAVAAATGVTLPRLASAADKPNSVFNGVRIGCITYSYRSMAKTAEETLKALLDDGLSETELMGGPIQDFAGIKGKATDAEREQQLAKCRELRKMYNDAGVNIHIHKMGFGQSDEEVEFSFLVAKALGCTGVTTERNAILDLGQYIGFNLDIGHYVAGSRGKSPIPVLEKYHDRIVSLHLKDRTADGGNVPWGQGQTPIKEVLQLMRKEKWTFPAEIELEYKIPEGSDAVKEVAKCVQYCKEALA